MDSSPKRSSSSPKWIRPLEVLSLRRKTKRTSSVLQSVDNKIFVPRFNPSVKCEQNKSTFNPFRTFPQKRKVDCIYQESTEDFKNVDNTKTTVQKQWAQAFFDESANSFTSNEDLQKANPPECSRTLPVDWSIKTRIRFMSSSPFRYRGSLKASEEASGSTSFVRCIHSTTSKEQSLDTSANARFHQQCLVWQQPSLPWLKLFPRIQNSEASHSSTINSQPMQEFLLSDWRESLRSLFHLVRVCQCPFFYLCGHKFNLLFRAAGVGGIADTHALMTPTTPGLQKLLKSQGIMFSSPLSRKSDSHDSDSSGDASICLPASDPVEETLEKKETPGKEEEEEEEEEEQDPEDFLESLGLSQQDFPTFNPKRRKIEEEMKEGDVGMQSGKGLLCVEGPAQCQTLLNFLLSDQGSSVCVPSTGPLAGVPPTLLSPCAFHGATLRSIRTRQGWIKEGSKAVHCVDISGPILPNMVHGLATLFCETQAGNFSAILASDASTAAFTSPSQPDKSASVASAFATENLKDCGLSTQFLLDLCTSSQSAVLHKIDSANKLFTWNRN